MTEFGLETSLPDWVIEHPESTTVFEQLGIDYSCGGNSLAYACEQNGLDPNSILSQLHAVIYGSARDGT